MSITFTWPEESERSKDALKRPDSIDQYRVLPGQKIDLDQYPTRYEGEITKKKTSKNLPRAKGGSTCCNNYSMPPKSVRSWSSSRAWILLARMALSST